MCVALVIFPMATAFKEATRGLNIKEGDELFTNAQQIWAMLDEMAANNPEAYQKFISKQKKEHDEATRLSQPPLPKFAVSTKDV
jgi:hypothetical protein